MYDAPMQGESTAADIALGNELLQLISRLNRWSSSNSDTRLPLPQVRLLSLIDQQGEAHISALARADNCTQPGMTLQIQRLQELQLVQRQPDPGDARAVLISLSLHGRDLLASVRDARARAVAPAIGQLDASARTDLQAALASLNHLLNTAAASMQAVQPPESA